MLSATIKITGGAEIEAKLKRLGESINHLTPAMTEIGRSAIRYFSTIGFTDKGAPYGATWLDLSANYKIWKEKHSKSGSAYPILINTGTMQDSFFATVTPTSVTIDNRAKYYKYHQSSAERHKIPRRQMAGINGNIKTIVANAIRDEVMRKLRG